MVIQARQKQGDIWSGRLAVFKLKLKYQVSDLIVKATLLCDR